MIIRTKYDIFSLVPTLVEAGDPPALLIYGCCKPADRNYPIVCQGRRSEDGGKSWSAPQNMTDFGTPIYSRTSGQLLMIGRPPSGDGIPSTPAHEQYNMTGDAASVSVSTPAECEDALRRYCYGEKGKKDACLECLNEHPAKFFGGQCTHSELSDYCDKTAPVS